MGAIREQYSGERFAARGDDDADLCEDGMMLMGSASLSPLLDLPDYLRHGTQQARNPEALQKARAEQIEERVEHLDGWCFYRDRVMRCVGRKARFSIGSD